VPRLCDTCAKQPRKWAGLLGCSAAFIEPPSPGRPLPPVAIVLADGSSTRSDATTVLHIVARTNRIIVEGLGKWSCAGSYATVVCGGTAAIGQPVTTAAQTGITKHLSGSTRNRQRTCTVE
jgi:hypothetical protein